jgi:hypothetical protein
VVMVDTAGYKQDCQCTKNLRRDTGASLGWWRLVCETLHKSQQDATFSKHWPSGQILREIEGCTVGCDEEWNALEVLRERSA